MFDDYVQAKQPLMQLKRDLLADLNADRGSWSEIRQGFRIYTRESQNPMLNANGGDYDYYTDYIIRDGVVVAITDWSADFDPRQWGVYSETHNGALSIDGLARLVHSLIKG